MSAYDPPAPSRTARREFAAPYPLAPTSAKFHQICHGPHRNLRRLRKLLRDPRLESDPHAALARGIDCGDWVRVVKPVGAIKARATLNASLAPEVVVGQGGWWHACREFDEPGYPVTGDDSAN